jgi:hypothetical protein
MEKAAHEELRNLYSSSDIVRMMNSGGGGGCSALFNCDMQTKF